MRVMEAVRPVAPPSDLQKVSVDSAPAAEAAPPPEAPKRPHKRKTQKAPANDVPF
jgi:hypothetical protein